MVASPVWWIAWTILLRCRVAAGHEGVSCTPVMKGCDSWAAFALWRRFIVLLTIVNPKNFLGLMALDWLVYWKFLQRTDAKRVRVLDAFLVPAAWFTRHFHHSCVASHQGSALNLRRSWSRSCSLFMQRAQLVWRVWWIRPEDTRDNTAIHLRVIFRGPFESWGEASWTCVKRCNTWQWWQLRQCYVVSHVHSMSKAKHQDDIITGVFSDTMMKDWDNDVLWLQDIGEWLQYQSRLVFFQVSHQLPEMSSGCQLAEVETRDCRDWLWEDTCWKHADQGRVLLCSDWKQAKERTRCIKNHKKCNATGIGTATQCRFLSAWNMLMNCAAPFE